jgi:putative transposase
MSTTSYPSDLSEAQWQRLEPLLPPPKPGGRERSQSLREVLNAIIYLTSTGCPWRSLPHDFPNYNTVFGYFNNWKRTGVWEQIHQQLRELVREQEGRHIEPSKGIIDSQSVKTVETAKVETRGFDFHKWTKGRKRQILVDAIGLILGVVITSANVTDRDGAILIFDQIDDKFPRLEVIVADQAYAGAEYTSNVQQTYPRQLKIIKRDKGSKGFQVLPSRWIVERTFGWLNHFRRLSKDYERQPQTSENFIYVAMISIMLRRLA